jgi:DNA-binding response OmpR family regulator
MAKLIIVEDDPFLLSILAEKLKEAGFDIETAIDGEDGLNKIKSGSFDLVLLDMVLPKIDGFKILEELRDGSQIKKIPVIVLSNLYDKNNIDKAILLGAREYIVKAYNTPEEIVFKIKSFLAKEGVR